MAVSLLAAEKKCDDASKELLSHDLLSHARKEPTIKHKEPELNEHDEKNARQDQDQQQQEAPPTKPVHTRRHFSFSPREIRKSSSRKVRTCVYRRTPADADIEILSRYQLVLKLRRVAMMEEEADNEEQKTLAAAAARKKTQRLYTIMATMVAAVILGFSIWKLQRRKR